MKSKHTHVDSLRSFEKMMDYFEELLEEEEKLLFEELMEKDKEFAAEVDELHEAWLRNPDLRSEVHHYHPKLLADLQRFKKNPPFPPWKLLLSVAAVVFLIVMGIMFWPRERASCPLDNIQMLAEEAGVYREQYSDLGAKEPDQIDSVFYFYTNGNYDQAIPLFEEIIDTTQRTHVMREMTLCLAVSYIMTERPSLAIPYLQRTRSFIEKHYTFQANWYEALIQLEYGDLDQAQRLFNQVVRDDSSYSDEAERIVTCMNK